MGCTCLRHFRREDHGGGVSGATITSIYSVSGGWPRNADDHHGEAVMWRSLFRPQKPLICVHVLYVFKILKVDA